MRRLLLLILTVFAALATPATATVITFQTAPLGPGFSGPVSENGFTYATGFGGLNVTTSGHPGQDIEGDLGGGGVLLIWRTDNAPFRFTSIDVAAFDPAGGAQDLIVAGAINEFVMFDTFSVFNSTTYPSTRWSTVFADSLDGVWIDELIVIIGGADGTNVAIDNLVLDGTVPEPASLMLLAAGLFFAARRRRI